MSIWWRIGAFILVLTPIILVHELGHFFAARLSGIRVDEFGLGFPPRAATLFKRNGTIYSLNWIPIGGFVRPAGEDDPLPGLRRQRPVNQHRARVLGVKGDDLREVLKLRGENVRRVRGIQDTLDGPFVPDQRRSAARPFPNRNQQAPGCARRGLKLHGLGQPGDHRVRPFVAPGDGPAAAVREAKTGGAFLCPVTVTHDQPM